MTYPAYEIVSNQTDKVLATIWWDGERLRSTSESYLKIIKHQIVDGLSYQDGEKFFKKIPNLFRSGYSAANKIDVDKEGNKV